MASISIDGEDFRRFSRDIKGLDKALDRDLKKELRGVVTSHIIPTARGNAGWSSRIPGAIKPQVTAKGIGVRVASRQAPHGRPYEGLQTGLRSKSSFRHPVFGNRNTWVSQRTRPYLAPAFRANEATAVKAAEKAVEAAARAAGFR